MQLPMNGRIVIVDDNIHEAAPIIEILSKRRIPFNYYSGTKSAEFPDLPNENKLRVLFLDLNIFELNQDPKTVISSIHNILIKLIPDNPNPFLLIVWSKHSIEYKPALEAHFREQLVSKHPVKIIFLQKQKYFDYIGGTWRPKSNGKSLKAIEKDLNKELESISTIRNFIFWENIVHKSAASTLSEFSDFYPFDADWDLNSRSIIYQLSKAIVGKEKIKALDDYGKLKTAFYSINNVLLDNLEKNIQKRELGKTASIVEKQINPAISIKINTRLHSSTNEIKKSLFEQGNVYKFRNGKTIIKNILRDKIVDENQWLVQLDVTPICDYSQDKGYVRTIYGVAVEKKYYSDYKKKIRTDYNYATPVLEISKEHRYLIFDFRLIETVTKEIIMKRNIKPIIKLRKELCTDIQSNLSNQINRPGVSVVE
jgi:hypothetical protein